MTGRRRRAARWVVLALAVLAGLGLVAAGAGWWAWRAYGPLLARDRVEAALAGALGRPVAVAAVDLRPWLGRLTIRGVTVAAGPSWRDGTLLHLERAELVVGVQSVWRREIVLSRITLARLDVASEAAGGGGAADVPLVVPGQIAAGPVTVGIGRVELEDARVRHRDPALDLTLEIDGLDLVLRPAEGATTARLEAAAVRVAVGGIDERMSAVRGEVRLAPDGLAIRELALGWEGERLRLEGTVTPPWPAPALALRVRGQLPIDPLARRLGAAWPIDATATVDLELDGAPAALRVGGRVAASRLTAGSLDARDVAVEGAWADGTLSVNRARARVADGTLQGTLAWTPARPSATRVTAILDGADLAALEALAGRATGARGRARLEADLTGPLGDPAAMRGTLRVASSDLVLPAALARLGAGPVQGTARLADGGVLIERATGRWGGVAVEVAGRVARDGTLTVDGRMAAPDLGALARRWDRDDVTGRATLVVTGSGRWPAPVVAARLEAPSLAVAGVSLADVHVAVRFADRALTVDDAAARVGRSRVGVSGTLEWAGTGLPTAETAARDVRVSLALSAPAARLEDADPWLPPAWRGTGGLGLAGRVEGTWEAWRARGTVESARLSWRDVPVEELRSGFTVTRERIEIQGLVARVRGVPVRLDGAWAWTGSGAAAGDVGPVRLDALPALPESLGLAGSGRARFEATVRGGAVRAVAEGRLDDVAAGGFPVGAGTFRVDLEGGQVRGALAFPERRLQAAVDGPLDGTLALDVRLDALDVAPVARRFLAERGDAISGTLTARAAVEVPVAAPAALRARVTLDPVRLRVQGEAWENRGPVELTWAGGTLRVARLRVGGPLGEVAASGRVTSAGELDLAVTGGAPLALLAAFRPEVLEAGGRLEMALTVGGSTQAPQIGGEGRIAAGRIVLRGFPDPIEDLEARFAGTPEALRLVEATARVGAGRVSARGEMALEREALGAYRVAFAIRGLPVFDVVEGLETVWDADLELTGLAARAQLTGEVRLVRGSYTRELSIATLALPGGGDGTPTFALPLRILVRLEDHLTVRNRTARLRLGGTVTVEGTSAAPALFGTIEAREGQVTFRGHRFTLQSASAQFADPRQIDPVLDIVATAPIRDWNVTVHVSGRAADLRVRLASTPPLPQEDLLALVAFGSTREELQRGAGGVLAREAAQLIVQDLLGFSLDSGGAGFDVLGVETSGPGGGALVVGKRLTDRALVVYEQSLTSGTEQKLRVEYQLFGPVLVTGEQNFRGEYGADLVVRLRFR